MSDKISSEFTISERFAVHYDDYKHYDTEKLRQHFLVDDVFGVNQFNWVYTHYDRMMVGGVIPTVGAVKLAAVDNLRVPNFLDRRELGVINVGGAGSAIVDGHVYSLAYKESLYVGKGSLDVQFKSDDSLNPAKFYCLSAPAHASYPTVKVGIDSGDVVELGHLNTSNNRTIRKLLVSPNIETCQLQMGMTELKAGSVWNTMPPHAHPRRMEVYFYFELPEDQAVCHFMGTKTETRHLFLKNNSAVVSPPWSIHCAAGTSNYTFIWGMAGENLDYGDMDFYSPTDLK